MSNTGIYVNIDAYVSFVKEVTGYDAPLVPSDILSQDFCAEIAKLLAKTKHNWAFYNYCVFTKAVKLLKKQFGITAKVYFFSKKLPALGYYVHKKNKYFNKSGIYLSVSLLKNLPTLARYFLHELCHHYVCRSAYCNDVFRLTREFAGKLEESGYNAIDFTCLYPTEFFALSMEKWLTLQIATLQPKGEILCKMMQTQEQYANSLKEQCKNLFALA